MYTRIQGFCRQPLPHEYMSIHVYMYLGAHNRYGNCMYIPLVEIGYLSLCIALVGVCGWFCLLLSSLSSVQEVLLQ